MVRELHDLAERKTMWTVLAVYDAQTEALFTLCILCILCKF